VWNSLENSMENTFWTALGASSLAALVTTIGIYVIRHFERWGRENTTYFICFAAGVLISVSFLHIIPTAFSMNTNASIYLFAGYTSLGPRKKIIPPLACLMARLLRYIHPHVSRYAQVDVPCRQTIIRRNRVKLFLTVTLAHVQSFHRRLCL
jgi:hypothetical protein